MADSVAWQAQLASRMTTMVESARELTQEASVAAGSRFGEDQAAPRRQDIEKLLSSKHERERLEGLKKVVSLMMQSKADCSEYFAGVVKNVAAPNLQARKLVYAYLVRYAESEPDLALLSINTIQKSLSDVNQVIRAMAIRVMSGIRVPLINGIVMLGIKRCMTDLSPIVRKAAALAIPKCYILEPTNLPTLTSYVATLIGDPSYFVLGAAVNAFLQICPERLEFVHPNYRRLCRLLPDIDEWGQVAVLHLLTIYARKNFSNHGRKIKRVGVEAFYASEMDTPDSQPNEDSQNFVLDDDLQLLLDKSKLLLTNRNSAVVMAVIKLYVALAPKSYLRDIAGPLIRLLRTPRDIQLVALHNIVAVALVNANVFKTHATEFLVYPSDNLQNARLKIEVLSLICDETNFDLILSELQVYAKSSQEGIVKDAIGAIGRIAQTSQGNAGTCVKWLLRQIESHCHTLAGECVSVIRRIIQIDHTKHVKTIIRVANVLDTTETDTARASVIWLVGEYHESIPDVYADVLRKCAKSFSTEAETVKLQIVLLACKVYARQSQKEEPDSNVAMLYTYVMQLARYDLSYDLRDRARTYKALLDENIDLAILVLCVPKPSPYSPSPSAGKAKYVIGSTALVVESETRGYEDLPDWPSASQFVEPSSVRDEGTSAETKSEQPEHLYEPPYPVSQPISRPLSRTASPFEPAALDIQASRPTGKIATLDEFFGGQTAESEESEYETDSDANDDK